MSLVLVACLLLSPQFSETMMSERWWIKCNLYGDESTLTAHRIAATPFDWPLLDLTGVGKWCEKNFCHTEPFAISRNEITNGTAILDTIGGGEVEVIQIAVGLHTARSEDSFLFGWLKYRLLEKEMKLSHEPTETCHGRSDLAITSIWSIYLASIRYSKILMNLFQLASCSIYFNQLRLFIAHHKFEFHYLHQSSVFAEFGTKLPSSLNKHCDEG